MFALTECKLPSSSESIVRAVPVWVRVCRVGQKHECMSSMKAACTGFPHLVQICWNIQATHQWLTTEECSAKMSNLKCYLLIFQKFETIQAYLVNEGSKHVAYGTWNWHVRDFDHCGCGVKHRQGDGVQSSTDDMSSIQWECVWWAQRQKNTLDKCLRLVDGLLKCSK